MACETQGDAVVTAMNDANAAQEQLLNANLALAEANNAQLAAQQAADSAGNDYEIAKARADEAWAAWRDCMDNPTGGGEPAPQAAGHRFLRR